MAIRNASVPSLLDVMNVLDPGGKLLDIAEILTQKHEFLDDMGWQQGNLVTGDRFGVRTSKPAVDFRRMNMGTPRSKGGSAQVDEATAKLVGKHQVDRDLAILSGDIAAYRVMEGKPFIEAMGDKLATTTWYGNSLVNDASFTGFTPRFNSLSGPTGKQIIDAGGTGTDNRSIWLVVWNDYVTGLYPKGSKGGLFHMDTTANMGMGPDGYPIGDEVLDSNGDPYLAYKDHWQWDCGLKIKDPRYVVRAANIDFSLLSNTRATGADIADIMIQMLGRVQGLNGNATFYASRDIHTMLDRQASNDSRAFNGMGLEGFGRAELRKGISTLTFRGIPIRREDALNVDEARVV
jgi:hypothetical protein